MKPIKLPLVVTTVLVVVAVSLAIRAGFRDAGSQVDYRSAADSKHTIRSAERSGQADVRETTRRGRPAGDSPSIDSGADEDYPDREELRKTIAAELEGAKGTFFNFSCACCGDHLQYLKILTERGLAWPRIWEGLDDHIAFNNLKFREEEAILRIKRDPEGAVNFFETQVRMEREKYETRLLREPWDLSRADGGAGDLAHLDNLVNHVPDSHFSGLFKENFGILQDAPSHLAAFAVAAWQRPESDRMQVFAVLADANLINAVPRGADALRELTGFLGDAPGDDLTWSQLVEDRLERGAMAASD